MRVTRLILHGFGLLAMLFSVADGVRFIVSAGQVPATMPKLTFSAYAPMASFGGTPSEKPDDKTGSLELMQPSKAAACDPFTRYTEMNMKGKAVLLVRGNCNFVEKARRAQAAGAKAVIVGNMYLDDGHLEKMPDVGPINMFGIASDVTIPVVMVSSQVSMRLTQYLMEVRTIRAVVNRQFPPKGCASSDDMFVNPFQCIIDKEELGDEHSVQENNDQSPPERYLLDPASWLASRGTVTNNESWMTMALQIFHGCSSLYFCYKFVKIHYNLMRGEARDDSGAAALESELKRKVKFIRMAAIAYVVLGYILYSDQLMSLAPNPATVRRALSTYFMWLLLLQLQVHETADPANIYMFPASVRLARTYGTCCQKVSILRLFSSIAVVLMAVDFGYIGFGGRSNAAVETIGWVRISCIFMLWLCAMVLAARFLRDIVVNRHRDIPSSVEHIMLMKKRALYTVVGAAWATVASFAQFICILCVNMRENFDSPGGWMTATFALALFQIVHLCAIAYGHMNDILAINWILQSTTDRQLAATCVSRILIRDGYPSMSIEDQKSYPRSVDSLDASSI